MRRRRCLFEEVELLIVDTADLGEVVSLNAVDELVAELQELDGGGVRQRRRSAGISAVVVSRS